MTQFKGEVPPGWKMAALSEIVDVLDHLRVPVNAAERASREGPYPYYGANGQAGTIDDFLFEGEHVLLAEDGGYFDDPSRSVAYQVSGRFWVNNHAHILQPRNGISCSFLTCLLNWIDWMPYVSGTTRLKLTQGKMLQAQVPVPPLAEQRRLVERIEVLESRTHATRAALLSAAPLLNLFRRSVLASAFRGDLTADWRAQNPDVEPASVLLDHIRAERWRHWEATERTKIQARGQAALGKSWRGRYSEPTAPDSSRLTELPDGWTWASLDQVLVKIEAGASFKCLERPPLTKEVGVVKVSAVTWGEYDEEESKTCIDSDRVEESLFVREGDFLFSRANTVDLVGACVIARKVSRRVMLSDKILRFHFAGVNPEWILAVLQSPWGRSEIERLATGNQLSMRNIGQDRIRQIRVPLPPLDEQKELVRRLEIASARRQDVRRIVGDAQDQLALLERSILAKAFQGELVPQDPDDEPASALLERIRAERAGGAAAQPRRGRRAAAKP